MLRLEQLLPLGAALAHALAARQVNQVQAAVGACVGDLVGAFNDDREHLGGGAGGDGGADGLSRAGGHGGRAGRPGGQECRNGWTGMENCWRGGRVWLKWQGAGTKAMEGASTQPDKLPSLQQGRHASPGKHSPGRPGASARSGRSSWSLPLHGCARRDPSPPAPLLCRRQRPASKASRAWRWHRTQRGGVGAHLPVPWRGMPSRAGACAAVHLHALFTCVQSGVGPPGWRRARCSRYAGCLPAAARAAAWPRRR